MQKFIFLLLASICLCGSVEANTLSQIKQSKVLRVGVSEHMAPFSSLKADGTFEGFEIDFAKEIAKAILGEDGEIQFVATPQGERLNYVKDNKVDLLIAAYTRNAERAKVADFSAPYFSINLATVSKKETKIHKISDLNGKKVGVINESNSDIWVRKNPNITPVSCKNNKDCYNKLKDGQIDAYMHNIVSVASLPIIDSELEIGIKRIGEVFFDCVVTQKGNQDLIELVDQKIFDLSANGYFKEEYKKTIDVFYRGEIDSKYFLLEDLYRSFLGM